MKEELNSKEKKSFRKSKLNFTIDVLGLVFLIAMVGTGLIIRYILPPGSGGRGGGHGLILWGMDRHEWGDVHFWLSVALLGLLTLHVALHWSWVCNFVRSRVVEARPLGKLSGKKAIAYGAGFFILLNVLIAWFIGASNSNVSLTRGGNRDLDPTDSESVQREFESNPNEYFSYEYSASEIEKPEVDVEHDCGKKEKHVHRGMGRGRRYLERKSHLRRGNNRIRGAGRRGRNDGWRPRWGRRNANLNDEHVGDRE